MTVPAPTAEEMGTLLVCTVRYALGKSYVVIDVAALVRLFYRDCTEGDQSVILANVKTHLAILNDNDAPCIRRVWLDLVDFMQEESA